MYLYPLDIWLHSMCLSLVAGFPLLLLLACCCLPHLRAVGFRLLPLAPLPALLAVLFIASGKEVHVEWFFMGSSMGIDATGRIFLGLTAWIWLFASVSAYDAFKNNPQRFRFAGFFLAAMSGNLGLILARDILGFYLFFALMSFSAYGLIAHTRSKEALKAGRVYLMLVFFSELAMFMALVIMSGQGDAPAISSIAGNVFSTAVIILLFIAFGVKVGALPFQSWMVLSYQQAPIPAALALAGAMVNAGILGWLRFFPFGQVVLPGGAVFFMFMGAAAALYGVIFGLYQRKIGRVLACSSISQMGLATVIAGFGLLSEETGTAALSLLTLFAVHHALAKASLFLGYGMVDRGGRWTGAFLAAGLLVPCLSLAGFPFTSGAAVKGGMKELAALAGAPWNLFGVFLPISSIFTTLLMLYCVRLFRQSVPVRNSGRSAAGNLWLISVAAVAAVPWIWQPLQVQSSHFLQPHALVQSLWPVALGIILALGWFTTGCRLPGRGLAVVGFDDLVHKLYVRCMDVLASATGMLDRWRLQMEPEQLRQLIPGIFAATAMTGKWEKVLGRWSVAGFLYLLVCILFFLILLARQYAGSGI